LDELTELPGSDQRPIWIPARRTLKHTSFDLPEDLSGRKRASALHLKISAWSPFQDTGYSVQWSGNQASVYAWDSAAINERVAALGYRISDIEVVPAAFMQRPENTGIRLTATTDGFEGQVWRNGLLAITRWWGTQPTPQEWALFQRSAGQISGELSANTLEAKSMDWLERPWTAANVGGDLLAQFFSNKKAVVWAGTAALIPCVFLLAQWFTFTLADQAVQRSILTVEETGQQIRQQRSAALSALETVEDYLSLKRYPSQIEIVSAAHDIIRNFPVTLSNWDYDSGELQFGLESDEELDAREFITAFENTAMFSEVSASTRGERLLLRMTVSALAGNSI